MVRLDETHSAHVGGKVVNSLATLSSFDAIVKRAQVEEFKLVAKLIVSEKFLFFPVNTNDIVSHRLEFAREVRADETACASDAYFALGGLGHFKLVAGTVE